MVGIKLGGGVIQHIAGGEEDGDDARAGVELALQQAAAEGGWGIFRLPIFCLPCAEMGVGEAVVVFGAGFAAADGRDEFAVEGEQHAAHVGVLAGGKGGAQVGGGVAVVCAEWLLRAGQDDGLALQVEREGEQVGGVGEGVGAVQDEGGIVLRQGGLQQREPVCPVLRGERGAVYQRVADVPCGFQAARIGLQGGGGKVAARLQALRGGGHADGAAGVEDVERFHGDWGRMRQPETRLGCFQAARVGLRMERVADALVYTFPANLRLRLRRHSHA